MTKNNLHSRMDNLEGSLSAKEAFLLWLRKAPEFRLEPDYTAFLLRQRPWAQPLNELSGQMEEGLYEAMKGRPRLEIERVVSRARHDVAFLFFLYERANRHLASVVLDYERKVGELFGRFLATMERNSLRAEFRRVCSFGIGKSPYPLDLRTAGAVDAALRYYVRTRPQVSFLEIQLVCDHFIRQGRKHLPGSFRLLFLEEGEDGNGDPFSNEDDGRLFLKFFENKAAVEEYKNRRDFSWGFADVRDIEFEGLRKSLDGAITDLIESGAIEAGTRVYLPSVPILFLQDVPLVSSEWIDEFVVELAECGAMLAERGYDAAPSFHPLGWCRFFSPKGDGPDRKEVSDKEIEMIRREVRANLGGFKGKRKEIEGRQYLHFSDYIGWKRRRVRGDLKREMRTGKGVVMASWSAWVEAHGGEGQAELAGVKVGRLDNGSVSRSSYVIFEDPFEAAAEQHALGKQVDELRQWEMNAPSNEDAKRVVDSFWAALLRQFRPFDEIKLKEEADDLRKSAFSLMRGVYATKAALDRISENFFQGQLVLWKLPAQWMDQSIEVYESWLPRARFLADWTAQIYGFAAPRPLEILKAEEIKKSIEPQVRAEYIRLIRHAKADMHFYFGEYEARRDLVLADITTLLGGAGKDTPTGQVAESPEKGSPRRAGDGG